MKKDDNSFYYFLFIMFMLFMLMDDGDFDNKESVQHEQQIGKTIQENRWDKSP